jgi:hypothetical protein
LPEPPRPAKLCSDGGGGGGGSCAGGCPTIPVEDDESLGRVVVMGLEMTVVVPPVDPVINVVADVADTTKADFFFGDGTGFVETEEVEVPK